MTNGYANEDHRFENHVYAAQWNFIRALYENVEERRADKPEWDGTPSAHPAYWRGRAARPATTAGGEEPRL